MPRFVASDLGSALFAYAPRKGGLHGLLMNKFTAHLPFAKMGPIIVGVI